MSLELIIFESQQSKASELQQACQGLASVTVSKVDRVIYTHPPQGLDAIFLVLPAAERWGALPLPGEGQVLKTTVDDQRSGMPRYVVAGVVLRAEDPRGPLPETRLLLSSAFEAVRQFNQSNKEDQIQRLGFWAENLLKGVTPEQLAVSLSELLEKYRADHRPL